MKYSPLILAFILVIVISTCGCAYKPNPGDIVACSDYFEITQHYHTPNGYYIVYQGYDGNAPQLENYNSWSMLSNGMFVQISPAGMPRGYPIYDSRKGYVAVSMTRLNETEYGMKDACMVIP